MRTLLALLLFVPSLTWAQGYAAFRSPSYVANLTAAAGGGEGGTGTAFVTGQSLDATTANSFTGGIGFRFQMTSSNSITALGRWVKAGNSGTHTIRIVAYADGTTIATVTNNISGATAGQYKYVDLQTPITLPINVDYCILSDETNGGDDWYGGETTLTTTAVGTVLNSVYQINGTGGPTIAGSGSKSYGPVSFKYNP